MATSPVIFVLSIAQESVTRTRSRADEAFVSVFPLFADHRSAGSTCTQKRSHRATRELHDDVHFM